MSDQPVDVPELSAEPLAKPRRRFGGRKRYDATESRRAHVMKLVGFGVTVQDIAVMMDINESTLRKYFARELKTGVTNTNVRVIGALFDSAVNRHSVPAQIYWTKARAGWRDSVDVNLTSDQPAALHLLAAQLISERLAAERGDVTPVIEGAVVDDDAPPKE